MTLPDLAHAALVRGTIAAGRITAMDVSRASTAPGVLAVITHENAPRLHHARRNILVPPPTPPLQTDEVDHYGQYVRSEEHTSELQSRQYLVCRLLLEKKK